MTGRIQLPIDSLLPQIQAAVRVHPVVILQATPGSGKTTRVPPALLDCVRGNVVVLEPRRLAARLSAERIAYEIGEKVGGTVGFRVRFQSAESEKTRLSFVTEGLLLRQLISDPGLSGVDCVVLDEFHERHIHGDVALAILRLVQKRIRPDLKIVIMSATLESDQLLRYFGNAELISIEARKYPLEVIYRDSGKEVTLAEKVGSAVEEVLATSTGSGHVLVFLPGAAEIRRAAERLSGVSSRYNAVVLELRGESTGAEQARVFEDSKVRKVILSTNVAETSITINGVDVVVDSGLAKIPGYAPWSGLPTLELKRVSQASCIQRAGRAGRTGPGTAIRLYSESDYMGRSPFERAELTRLDLAQMLLETKSMLNKFTPKGEWHELEFVDEPPVEKIKSGVNLLRWLGALDTDSEITDLGRKMASFPLHPRLSRIVLEGEKRGIGDLSPWAVAVLGESNLLYFREDARSPGESDVLKVLKQIGSFRRGFDGDGEVRRLEETAQQISRISQSKRNLYTRTDLSNLSDDLQEKLCALLFVGFPDRVAKARSKNTLQNTPSSRERPEYNMCLGGGTVLGRSSCAWTKEWILCLDGEESLTASASQSVVTRIASAIDPLNLLDGPAEFMSDGRDHFWDKTAERVRCFDRVSYGKLVVEERQAKVDVSISEDLLAAALKERWPKPFPDGEPLLQYRLRTAVAKKYFPALDFPTLEGEEFDLLLAHISTGKVSFADILSQSLDEYIDEQLSESSRSTLRAFVPTHVTIGGGRRVKVNYDAEKPPWIESRLQDFFGTIKTPSVADGRLPLVVHLLAPNKRAVQVTQDLASFWKNSYPAVRRELSRNYPRHSWPEDPESASPPPPNRLR